MSGRPQPDHEALRDSLAAHLLGALPDDERDALDAHLAGCARCRREREELRVAVDLLPYAAPPVPAPRALRDRLTATVRAEGELLRAAGPDADAVAPAARRRRRHGRSKPHRRRLAIGAAVAATAAAAAAGFVVGGEVSPSPSGAGPARVLSGHVSSDLPATARVSLAVRDGHATLRARGVPNPPPGRVYQVWLRPAGRPGFRPTKALWVPDRDHGQTVALASSARGADEVAVTAEPPGGSASPTRPPVMWVATR